MKNIILSLVIIILIFLTMKDYVETFQTCDSNKIIKGDVGVQGQKGINFNMSVDNSKKEVINKFVNDLRFRNNNFYLGTVLLGC